MHKRVSYIFPTSHHYRFPFHVKLREHLARHGVDYRVVYSEPFGDNLKKKDTVDIDWGFIVRSIRLFGNKIILQLAFRNIHKSDLVIIQQENKLLINYYCQFLSHLGFLNVAYFGHGRNFQSHNNASLSEKWKAFWATKVNWWFAYTDQTKQHVASLGFPEECITVFNNAIDTDSIQRHLLEAPSQGIIRDRLGIKSENIGIFVGGLYPEKRIDFLINASRLVREKVPDFTLIVVGGGPDSYKVEEAASHADWIHYTGPLFGREKTEILSLGRVLLMPGLVGLGVLDSFAVGAPMVTTAYPYHSPEIAYLENDVNGVIVEDQNDDEEYSSAVARLLLDAQYRERLQEGGRISLKKYTVDAMAERFANGVLAALKIHQ